MSNDDKLGRVERMVEDIHHRLFLGNGKPSMMTQLDRHEQQLGVIRWVIGVLFVAVVTVLVKSFAILGTLAE